MTLFHYPPSSQKLGETDPATLDRARLTSGMTNQVSLVILKFTSKEVNQLCN